MKERLETEQPAWRLRRAGAVLAAIGAALLLAAPASAQDAHDHTPVTVDGELTLEALLGAALEAYPRSGELLARAQEAEAWRRRGSRWLAAAPALYFSYLSDRPYDDRGQREYEGGLELPIWRFGERAAVQALASSAAAEGDAARSALRLEIAGLLRGALWDIEAAAAAAAAAEASAAVAARLVATVERRQARGDLALADVLLARTAQLERDQAVITAHADLVDAERAYQSLTGLSRRPAEFAETRSGREDLNPSHPLLALANAQVERARASTDLLERQARGSPTVAIGPRRQRDPLTDFFNDSVTVGLRVPIGGKSHVATQRAASSRLLAETQAARGMLIRRLELDLHEAAHTLLVLDESLTLAAEQQQVADRQRAMAESAFEQGEIDLRELLRIQDTAQAVHRDAQRLALERQRTIAAYNQAIGETP